MRLRNKERLSNFELLRLVCMFMVMACHANRYVNESDLAGAEGIIRLTINQLCLVCVNGFVMISGWFGIKASWKGVANILFQVIFCATLCFFIFLVAGRPVSINQNLTPYLLFGSGYWFVVSYLILYALSPVLEIFVNNVSESVFRSTLVFMFVAEMVYGFLLGHEYYFFGYSPLSFICIYLLARYTRLYPGKLFSLDKKHDLMVYAVTTILSIFGFWFGYKLFGMGFHLNHYDSPLAIIGSLYLLLFFSKLQFNNKAINWLASSAFSIYLFQENNLVSPIFHRTMDSLHLSLPIIGYYLLFPFVLIGFGLLFILVDKIRLLLWRGLIERPKTE